MSVHHILWYPTAQWVKTWTSRKWRCKWLHVLWKKGPKPARRPPLQDEDLLHNLQLIPHYRIDLPLLGDHHRTLQRVWRADRVGVCSDCTIVPVQRERPVPVQILLVQNPPLVQLHHYWDTRLVPDANVSLLSHHAWSQLHLRWRMQRVSKRIHLFWQTTRLHRSSLRAVRLDLRHLQVDYDDGVVWVGAGGDLHIGFDLDQHLPTPVLQLIHHPLLGKEAEWLLYMRSHEGRARTHQIGLRKQVFEGALDYPQ